MDGLPGPVLERHVPPLAAGAEPPDDSLELLPQPLRVRAEPAYRQEQLPAGLFGLLPWGALLYREPKLARAVHTQDASYLDAIRGADGADDDTERNPSDYAYHLTRRPRGLPLWFSLAVHGTDAYRDAVAHGADIARRTARLVEQTEGLELLREPELTVVLIRRTGWQPEDYYTWSKKLLAAGTAFITPSVWEGETVARLAFLHPGITEETVRDILDSLLREG